MLRRRGIERVERLFNELNVVISWYLIMDTYYLVCTALTSSGCKRVGTENGNVCIKYVILIFLFFFQGIIFLSIGVIRFIIMTLFSRRCKYVSIVAFYLVSISLRRGDLYKILSLNQVCK